mmetsp:Transcript_9944/g.40260  ORF Transcript_9944/g.40260 Transcript_9944/m.40260 type:complete len:217 (+) Transcript_9944:603-1253(+)
MHLGSKGTQECHPLLRSCIRAVKGTAGRLPPGCALGDAAAAGGPFPRHPRGHQGAAAAQQRSCGGGREKGDGQPLLAGGAARGGREPGRGKGGAARAGAAALPAAALREGMAPQRRRRLGGSARGGGGARPRGRVDCAGLAGGKPFIGPAATLWSALAGRKSSSPGRCCTRWPRLPPPLSLTPPRTGVRAAPLPLLAGLGLCSCVRHEHASEAKWK